MRLSRRQFILPESGPCHISSLVVHSRPEKLEANVAAVAAMPNAEVPKWDAAGKFVVLLECEDEAALMQGITNIELLPGVISASLVYHQIDD